MNAPWLKFYPSDWRSDPALRLSGLSARGLWTELLCIMHEAEPRGYLVVGGASLSNTQIASLIGAPPKEVACLLAELKRNGVLSETDDGVIYSRRMVRDTEKAARDKANGKTGGNPRLNGRDKGGVNPPDNGGLKAQKLEAREEPSQDEGFREGSRLGAAPVVVRLPGAGR